MSTPYRIDLPDEHAARLSALATFRSTTPEQLLAEPAESLLGDGAALEAALSASQAEMAAGLDVPHEEVMDDMRLWAADLRTRHAAR
jgi:predicted transcriptional regulator